MALTIAQLTEQIELLTKRLDAATLILESQALALESLSEAHQVTAGYVRRIGECPGLKLF